VQTRDLLAEGADAHKRRGKSMAFPTFLPQLPATLLPALSRGLRAIPASVHSEALSLIVNHLIKGQWVREQLQELDGKRIGLRIRDAETELRFEVAGPRLIRAGSGSRPDVIIEGDLHDFWLLASRQEDADTLFFHRRLALKGDVATGLQVKNLLDSLEYDTDAHLRAVLGERAGNLAAGAASQLRRAAGAWRRQP
jgi:predicted lipid carrier protein YhbT